MPPPGALPAPAPDRPIDDLRGGSPAAGEFPAVLFPKTHLDNRPFRMQTH
jgi:hypothetical protein